ncbi:MAG: type II secretion system F family protein [Candidatus Lindowbacteria bacterium]|nr:type II secretion system F family protein [Candidatus Lindowbacteria bacterium]
MIGAVVLIKRFKAAGEGSHLDEILAPYVETDYHEKLEEANAEEAALGLTKEDDKGALTKVSKIVERIVLFQGYRDNLAIKISQAGMKWRASEYLTLMMGVGGFSFFLGLAFGAIMFGNMLLVGIPMGVMGFFFPSFVLGIKKSGRQAKFQGQLVDNLGLISNSLKAGYSFLQAVELVSREAPSPSKDEFARMIREHSLGMPLDDAMDAMAERLESDDFSLTVTVVLIQRQVGGNLAEILENIATTIRERIKLVGTINALTAQGKMGGMVITGLPFGLYGIMYFMNPDVMGMLFQHLYGYVLIVIGLIMQGMGAFVIYSMLQVEL